MGRRQEMGMRSISTMIEWRSGLDGPHGLNLLLYLMNYILQTPSPIWLFLLSMSFHPFNPALFWKTFQLLSMNVDPEIRKCEEQDSKLYLSTCSLILSLVGVVLEEARGWDCMWGLGWKWHRKKRWEGGCNGDDDMKVMGWTWHESDGVERMNGMEWGFKEVLLQ